jgi:hypothetical protein
VLLPENKEKIWISDTNDTNALIQLLLPFEETLMEKQLL